MVRKTSHQNVARRPVDYSTDTASHKDIAVVHARLQASQILSLADENDCGGDPYNNTGQHATLGAKRKL
jgi:hypothetical protein